MAMIDVLVVGGVGVDTIVRVPELPLPGGDSLAVPPIQDFVGHTGTGVACGIRALGRSVALLDFVGEDPQGAQVRAFLAAHRVEFHGYPEASGTRRAVNLVDAAGRRQSLYDGRHPAGLRLPAGAYLPLVERARHVHLSIMDFARHLYPDVDRLGRSTSTDLHDWDGESAHHRDFALRSRIVFLSAARLGARAPEVMARILDEGRAEVVVATDGAAGSRVLVRGAAEPVHVPVADLGLPIVDSNGAGDAFASGFLHGYLSGSDWISCARLGAIAGAYACATAGTHTSIIDADTLARYAAVQSI